MIKKIITILIIITVLVGFYIITSRKPASVNTDSLVGSDLILFYGSTCPHCKIVEEFISTNKIDQKLKINQLEVYNDKSNADVFSSKVQEICPDQLNSNGLPVPFLIDQIAQKCILGDTPITDYLSEKTK